MKNKIIRNAVTTAKTLRSKITPKITPKVTKVTPKVTRVTKTQNSFNNILNVFNIISLITSITSTLSSLFGPKFKIFAPFLGLSMLIFRRSMKLYILVNAILFILITLISLISGDKIPITYATLLQLLSLPVTWLLDYLDYSFDNFLNWFKTLINNVSDPLKDNIKELNNPQVDKNEYSIRKRIMESDSHNGYESKILKDMKQTYESTKDSDIISNSTPNYNNYYIIAGVLITIIAVSATLYFNPGGITDYLTGCYYLAVEWIQSWFRPRDDDGSNSFFRKIRWSAIFAPAARRARREQLGKDAELAAQNTTWDARDYTSDDIPFDINPEVDAFDTAPDNTPKPTKFVEIDLNEVNDKLGEPSKPWRERTDSTYMTRSSSPKK